MLAAFRRSIAAPEIFIITVMLLFGGIAALATPISAGYDEETHLVRAWQMAHFDFIPNEQLGARLPFPALFWELSYRREPIVGAVEPGLWSKYGALRMDAHDYIYTTVETRSVYSPLLLLPQALTLRYLGLSFQWPALAVYYACRFAGLLSYLILCWLAIRSVPYGKWLMAILMLSPMAIFQASTINTDAITNGIGFLFLAGSLALANRDEISWKEWGLLLGLIALLFAGKVNLIFLVLLPFLLIRPSKFKMKYGYTLLIAASLVLFTIEVVGWNVVAYAHFTRALEGANPAEQVRYILSAPLNFVRIIAWDVWNNTVSYMQGWIGVYGYNYWPVPGLTYWLYPLAVVLGLLAAFRRPAGESTGAAKQMPRATRFILLGLFIAGYLLTIISLYVAFTPVKSQVVAGVQGRYFTPVMPLLLLAGVGLSLPRLSERIGHAIGAAQWVAPTLAVGALALYTAGLILSYHVPCGSEYYRFDLCFQPEYKNWAPQAASSPPVTPSLSLTQEIVPACDGMREVLVWVNSPGSDPSGSTQLTLRATQQEEDLVQKTFKNSELPEVGWVRLSFDPQWHSQDNLYLLTITGTSSGGMQVGYSLKPEYMKGKLFENDTAVGQDMLFQYGCIAGLQRWQMGK